MHCIDFFERGSRGWTRKHGKIILELCIVPSIALTWSYRKTVSATACPCSPSEPFYLDRPPQVPSAVPLAPVGPLRGSFTLAESKGVSQSALLPLSFLFVCFPAKSSQGPGHLRLIDFGDGHTFNDSTRTTGFNTLPESLSEPPSQFLPTRPCHFRS